jgi:RNA polymerase primary sigma factor
MRQLNIKKQITQRTEDSINRYFQEINKYPMISVDEEVELTVRIRSGDIVALEKLVVSNLRFVVSVAKQFQNQGLSFPDLINEGNLGLVKAAKKFDETRGFKFISYAVWWIRQSIIQAISEQSRIVRLPLNRISSINKVSKAIPHLEQKYEREPTSDEIADYLDCSRDEVSIANILKNKQVSFDIPISHNNDSDFNLYDIFQADNIPSPDYNILRESLIINTNRALNKLTKRESVILTMSFGLCNTPIYSLREIAVINNMSSERVRQIKNKGLIKLKILLKNKNAFFQY